MVNWHFSNSDNIKPPLLKGVAATFRTYGLTIGNSHLAEVVIMLYKAARANSTRKSYIVGQRHWVRF